MKQAYTVKYNRFYDSYAEFNEQQFPFGFCRDLKFYVNYVVGELLGFIVTVLKLTFFKLEEIIEYDGIEVS